MHEDFESWFARQQQRLSFQNVNDISLATDGIFTFDKFNQASYPEKGNVAEHLLIDRNYENSPDMLDRKMKEIKDSWVLGPTDDLAIVRIILAS
ncbi:hypothetical protein ACFOTA_05405 [Chitinophaga sp. GCM10012297]|uniref:Uncharacterized protein n=1 Tax=Chitinophaga chungangae TaxID=2821488 RepID=A0ABS3YAC7_9BACT|nr:hypothetical protein [Chitinophaga chungangae]